MDTNIWGPLMWNLIHDVCHSYDVTMKHLPLTTQGTEQKKELRSHIQTFILSLQYVLPCVWCRKHFREYLAQNSFLQDPSFEALRWSHFQHDLVNQSLNKPLYHNGMYGFETLLKKIQTYGTLTDVDKLFTLFGILAVNLPNKPNDMTSEQKMKGYAQFFNSLSVLLSTSIIESKNNLLYTIGLFMKEYPMSELNIESNMSLCSYISLMKQKVSMASCQNTTFIQPKEIIQQCSVAEAHRLPNMEDF